MKTVLPIFLICATTSLAQGQTGFFLPMDDVSHCQHLVQTLDQKDEYCITEEPIINESEFKVEGGLQNDLTNKNQFFNLRFNQTGFDKLKVIVERLPEKKLIFVVKGRAVAVCESKRFKPDRLIQISGKGESTELGWVLENLKKTD